MAITSFFNLCKMSYSIHKVCHQPRIYLIDNFLLSEHICTIIAEASNIVNLHRQGITTRHDETGFSFEMPIRGNPILSQIQSQLDEVVGFTNLLPNSMRYRAYNVGEYHRPHLDTYVIDDKTLILTALMTLTDVESGGETLFPYAKPDALKFPPKAGRLLLWYGHLPNTQVDQLSLHESLPVKTGIKCTLTYFYYQSLEYSKIDLVY